MEERGVQAAKANRSAANKAGKTERMATSPVCHLERRARRPCQDQVLAGPAPVAERWLADAKLLSDVREAHAPGAQLDKLLSGFLVFHTCVLLFK
jgi:hypothetical protein